MARPPTLQEPGVRRGSPGELGGRAASLWLPWLVLAFLALALLAVVVPPLWVRLKHLESAL